MKEDRAQILSGLLTAIALVLSGCLWDPVHHNPRVRIEARIAAELLAMNRELYVMIESGVAGHRDFQVIHLHPNYPEVAREVLAGQVHLSGWYGLSHHAVVGQTVDLPNARMEQIPVYRLSVFSNAARDSMLVELQDAADSTLFRLGSAIDTSSEANSIPILPPSQSVPPPPPL